MKPVDLRVLNIARDALDVDEEARPAFLVEACAGDADLRRRVDRLLNATVDDDRVTSAGNLPAQTSFAAGDMFGPYRLIRPLGSGGMGVVWLAERVDGAFQRSVALKLLRGGLFRFDGHFRRERDILAKLDHPNIASLYDGGATGDHPWFVLEYVDGEQVLDYADARKLDTRARVRLLLPICAAVQFAHQHLVVHRDIKPANVLVSSTGEPKLLDFGIAKLLGDADARQTQTFAMTPAYASPEQRRGEPVGTAGDVYQLGLLLFELLLGIGAHESRNRKSVDSVPRIDMAYTRLDAGVQRAIAEVRSCSPERLRAQLRGDLARITAKALADVPGERYESPAALAEDLRNWLEGRPVRAHRGSFAYRAAKFVRRNGSTSVAVLLLVLATAYYVVDVSAKSRRISAERDQARAVSTFLQDLFRGSDPREVGASNLTARELLDRGVVRLDGDHEIEPNTRAALEGTIARSYQSLGLYGPARRLYADALARLDKAAAGSSLLEARLLKDSTSSLLDAADTDMATRQLQAARAILAQTGSRTDMRNAYLEGVVAMSLSMLRRPAEAQVHYDHIAAMRLALFDQDRRFFAEMLSQRADNEQIQLNAQRAEEGAREAVEVHRVAFGERDVDYALAQALHADTLTDVHRYAEAEAAYLAAIASLRATLGPEHREVGVRLSNLGLMYLRLGRFDEARAHFREALGIMQAVFGPDHIYLASPLLYEAWADVEQGASDSAQASITRAHRIVDAFGLPPMSARVTHVEARVACLRGQVESALSKFAEAERVYVDDQDPFRGPALALHRAKCLISAGRADEGRRDLAAIAAALEKGLGAEAWDTREARRLLAEPP